MSTVFSVDSAPLANGESRAAAADAAKKPLSPRKQSRRNDDGDDGSSSSGGSSSSRSGGERWDTLKHNGVLFPPAYVPHGRPFLYDGQTVAMCPEVEEVATMFAGMRNADLCKNERFRKNFFQDFRGIIKTYQPDLMYIRDLGLCDFTAIHDHVEAERLAKINLPIDVKKGNTRAKEANQRPFKFCEWNGRTAQVANFSVEPPGLFQGRGNHPLMGKLKRRVYPEDIIINIGNTADAPPPPPGHQWREVVSDRTVTWLARWHDNLTRSHKYMYVMMGESSTIPRTSDTMTGSPAAVAAPATATATPLRRIAGITVRPAMRNRPAVYQDQAAVLWGALDVCAAAEQRARDTYSFDSVPAALMMIEFEFQNRQHATSPIIGPLTNRYPALVRSLRRLKIDGHRFDESAALGAFADLATHLRELILRWCAVRSIEGLAGRCPYLQKVDLWDCEQLKSLVGLEQHSDLEEVSAAFTPITTIEPLRSCPALLKVVLSGCKWLTSIEGLADHQRLQEVNASDTTITSIEPLLTCPALERVLLDGCLRLPDDLHLPAGVRRY